MATKEETILAFQESILEKVFPKQNDVINSHDYMKIIKDISKYAWFGPREILEQTYNFRQIIPYVIVSSPNIKQILTYKRSNKAGDARLHNMYSIGFGGHIKIQDHDVGNLVNHNNIEKTILTSIKRELLEELHHFNAEGNLYILGYIRLPQPKPINNEHGVNGVHLGLVFNYRTTNTFDSLVTNEDDMRCFKLKDINTIIQDLNTGENRLEDWSLCAMEFMSILGYKTK